MKISFTVFGHPEPQGSTRAFVPRGWKRVIITSDNAKLKPWRQQVTRAAIDAVAKEREGLVEPIPRDIPVRVRLDFYLARPASLPRRFTEPTKKPDISKLVRSTEDSLTGVIYVDDSQIVTEVVNKRYGSPERVEIFVSTEASFYEEARVKQTMELFA